MQLDWHKIWLEFDEIFDKALQRGMNNTWSNQQKIIQRVVERNLTQRAPDAATPTHACNFSNSLHCPACGKSQF